MSHFYGGVRGARGEATRTGHKSSGIRAYAKSWRTRVEVDYHHHPGIDDEYVTVTAGNVDTGRKRVLWQGTEAELLKLLGGGA